MIPSLLRDVDQMVKAIASSLLPISLCVPVMICLSFPISARAAAAGVSAEACDYDSLGPGGYYQGVPDPYGIQPCDMHMATDNTAAADASAFIHPGVSTAPSGGDARGAPGSNSSYLAAIAFNGGGAVADAFVFYHVVNKFTGALDPGSLEFLNFTAAADIDKTDGFRFWSNAGWSICVSEISHYHACDVFGATGSINANNGANYTTISAGTKSATLKGVTQLNLRFPIISLDGTIAISESVYANLTSDALLDPVLSVGNPNDVLVPLSSYNIDPNAPIFTSQEVSLMRSYGIDLSPLVNPMGSRGVPEPGTLSLLGFALAALGCVSLVSTRPRPQSRRHAVI